MLLKKHECLTRSGHHCRGGRVRSRLRWSENRWYVLLGEIEGRREVTHQWRVANTILAFLNYWLLEMGVRVVVLVWIIEIAIIIMTTLMVNRVL